MLNKYRVGNFVKVRNTIYGGGKTLNCGDMGQIVKIGYYGLHSDPTTFGIALWIMMQNGARVILKEDGHYERQVENNLEIIPGTEMSEVLYSNET